MSNTLFNVGRRRKGEGPLGRAEAPRRESGGSMGGFPPVGGGRPSFGARPPKWVQLYAVQGDYMVGFIVEDLDGNQYPAYTQITVR